MEWSLKAYIKKLQADYAARSRWIRLVMILACITVFVTTYLLMIPAVTMDSDSAAKCGYESHTHTELCYDEENHLICTLPVHEHDMACFSDGQKEPLIRYDCGYESHMHSGDCYDEENHLICEIPEHEHTDLCLRSVLVTATDSDQDAAPQSALPVCGYEYHMHTPECYDQENNLICVIPEHEHTFFCYPPEHADMPPAYSCGFESHIHTEDCYDTDDSLICGIPEHVHSDECVCRIPPAEPEMHLMGAPSGSPVLLGDDPSAPDPSDLANFVTCAEIKDINDNDIDITSGTVYVGEHYKIRLFFSEKNTLEDYLQFQYAGDPPVLTYHLDSLQLNFHPVTGQPITVLTDGQTFEVGSFDVDSSGTITVHFYDCDNNGNPATGNFIDLYDNVSFNLGFDVTVQDSDEEQDLNINIGSNVVIELLKEKDGELDVEKSVDPEGMDRDTHTIPYTVKVRCTKGVVSDIYCSDLAYYRGANRYDLPASAWRNVQITDLDGNSIPGLTNDFSYLPGPIANGEGYKITYLLKIDPALYDDTAIEYANLINTFTADGTNINNEPVSDSETVTYRDRFSNLSKSGVLDTETVDGKYLIHWRIEIGNGETVIPAGVTLTDTLPSGLDAYTVTNAKLSTTSPGHTPAAYYFTWGDDAVIAGRDITFTLPGNETRYTLEYDCVTEDPGSYQNSITYDETGWTSKATVNIVGAESQVLKEFVEATPEYFDFKITALVPAGLHDEDFYIYDGLTDLSRRNTNNPNLVYEPVILSVTAEDSSGVKELERYPQSTEGPTYDFITSNNNTRHRKIFYFLPGTGTASSSTSSMKSPFAEDTIVTINYRIYRDEVYSINDPSGLSSRTVNEALKAGATINNYAQNPNWKGQEVYYTELAPISKSGTVTDPSTASFEFRIALPNEVMPGISDTYDRYGNGSAALLSPDFTDAYFHDTMDERLEYEDGSLYALVYQRYHREAYNLAVTYGQGVPLFGIFKYIGDGIDDNQIDAAWSDFTGTSDTLGLSTAGSFVYDSTTGQVRFYAQYHDPWTYVDNLEQMLQAKPEAFGVVFVYKAHLKPQYCSADVGEITVHNEADIDWQLPGKCYTTGPAATDVTYDPKLVDKTCIPVTGSNNVRYTITINPYGIDMTGGSFVTVEDQMCSSLRVYMDTIHIETGEYNNSTQDTAWSAYTGDPAVRYDEANNTLKMTLPDDVPIRITYECYVDGESGETVNLSNSVSLSGHSSSVKTSQAEFDVSGSGSGAGSASDQYMYVIKNDILTQQSLNGARFELYGPVPSSSADPSVTVSANGETLYYYRDYVTADNPDNPILNGSIKIDQNYLEVHGHYALVEAVPPEGYELSAMVMDFYWQEAPANAIPGVPVYEHRMTYTFPDVPMAPALPATGSEPYLLIPVIFFLISGGCISALGVIHFRRKKRRKAGEKDGGR